MYRQTKTSLKSIGKKKMEPANPNNMEVVVMICKKKAYNIPSLKR